MMSPLFFPAILITLLFFLSGFEKIYLFAQSTGKFAKKIGISLTLAQLIMSCVIEKLRDILPKESDYLKQIKEMANKGKEIPSYNELYNTFILYYTLAMILIAIQTSIPSVKTRNFPFGMVKTKLSSGTLKLSPIL